MKLYCVSYLISLQENVGHQADPLLLVASGEHQRDQRKIQKETRVMQRTRIG